MACSLRLYAYSRSMYCIMSKSRRSLFSCPRILNTSTRVKSKKYELPSPLIDHAWRQNTRRRTRTSARLAVNRSASDTARRILLRKDPSHQEKKMASFEPCKVSRKQQASVGRRIAVAPKADCADYCEHTP